MLNLIRRCPECNSIWVCWNWVHVPIEISMELNPHRTKEELEAISWGHECWNCGDDLGGHCFTTKNKVTNGVPYWLLCLYGRLESMRG